MTRLAVVVTHPMTAKLLLRGQLGWFRERGFDVTVICGDGPGLKEVEAREQVQVCTVPMAREISPLQDLVALRSLIALFRELRPQIVNGSTPKAGLLAMLAAARAGVPVRFYTLRGLRLETTQGPKRWLLSASERVAAGLADEVVCVSPSIKAAFGRLRLGAARKAVVLGEGSSNGVDGGRVEGPVSDANRRTAKKRLNLDPDRAVVGFVGRLTRDKGVNLLLDAISTLHQTHPGVQLLLVGEEEAGDPLSPKCRQALERLPHLYRPGFVADPGPYYQAMDVFAFPSRREGFPNAPMEAALRGIPTVGFRVTGTRDAVVEDQTGLLVEDGNADAFLHALRRYLDDPGLRRRHGRTAEQRVRTAFRPEAIWSALEQRYRVWLRVKGGRQQGLPRAMKRAIDVGAAAALLSATSPLSLLTALALRASVGSPVLFRQLRPGRAEQCFELLKFRTMTDQRDLCGQLLPDQERLTRVGAWVRSLSLDELPQLLNVLKGDMSLVGPRPLLVQYLDRYNAKQRRRHDVYPGITGWAQIHGRNQVDWERRFRLDVDYVDSWSLSLDVGILIRTLWVWASRQGVREEGQATMREFQGANPSPQPLVARV